MNNQNVLAAAPDHIADARKMAAPDEQMVVVGWQFYQDGKWWHGDDRIKLHRENTEAAGIPVRDVYAIPQPTEQQPDVACSLLVEAPSNSLPNWSECSLRVGNSEWLKDNGMEDEGDSLTANPLHEFIYEYDDSDAYKSAWFLHRLENLIDFIRSEQQPDVTQLVEALELFVSNPTPTSEDFDKAYAALAAYRKQGGEV